MNNRPNSSDDVDVLAMYACGELDAEQKAAIDAELANDPARKEELRRLVEAVSAVTPQSPPKVSEGFNERLRRRFLAQQQAVNTATRATGKSKRTRLMRPFLELAGAAAAVFVIAVLLWSSTNGASVAWGNVVKAMDQVTHFRATVMKNRDSEHNEQGMLEFFYKAPGHWRAHGFNQVQFLSQGKVMAYDIKERRFVERPPVTLIPSDLAAWVSERGLLQSVLHQMFQGEVPPGEPVKASVELLSDDLEVFDYAADAKQQWCRIWVLKESRLPIRMKVYSPRSGRVMMVVFDYSDPQPERFFDADKFAEEVKSRRLRRPWEIFAVGTTTVRAKPRVGSQIYQLQGYGSPELLEIVSNDLGDLMIVSTDPENMDPRGQRVDGIYPDHLRDNWGNTYLRCGAHSPVHPQSRRWYQFYTLAEALNHGDGKHTVTLRYTVPDPNDARREVTISEKSIEVPSPTLKGIPNDWKDYCSESLKRTLRVRYYRKTWPAMEQLAYVDKWLTKEPTSEAALLWKIGLLKTHGREDEAYALFEKTLKDKILTGPFDGTRRGVFIAQYLFYLLDKDRAGEIGPIVRKLEAAKQAVLADTSRENRSRARRIKDDFEKWYSDLPVAMQIPTALAAFEKSAKPKVVRTIRSKDGYVFVELSLPAPTGQQTTSDVVRNWSGPHDDLLNRWLSVHAHFDFPEAYLYLILQGDNDRLELTFTPILIADKQRRIATRRTKWRLKVDLPKPTVDDFGAWIQKNHPKIKWPEKLSLGHLPWRSKQLFDLARYEEAIEICQRMINAPWQDWEDRYEPDRMQREARCTIVKCLARLGRLDEAMEMLRTLEGSLPSEVNVEHYDELWKRWRIRVGVLEIARYLMKKRRLLDAAKILDRIEQNRPDLRKIDDRSIIAVSPPPGYRRHTWRIHKTISRNWREFDTVRWNLAEARITKSAPAIRSN